MDETNQRLRLRTDMPMLGQLMHCLHLTNYNTERKMPEHKSWTMTGVHTINLHCTCNGGSLVLIFDVGYIWSLD